MVGPATRESERGDSLGQARELARCGILVEHPAGDAAHDLGLSGGQRNARSRLVATLDRRFDLLDERTDAALRRLVPGVISVLNEAIEAGGSTLRDYAQPSGQLGYFAKHFDVYGREGEPCSCGGIVRRIVQGGRSTWYCPNCQK